MLHTDYEKEQQEIELKGYLLIQKLLGLVLIVVSILLIIILKDPTFSTIGLPLGLFMIFSKQKIITI